MRDWINQNKWIVIILCGLVGIYFLWPIISDNSDIAPQNATIVSADNQIKERKVELQSNSINGGEEIELKLHNQESTNIEAKTSSGGDYLIYITGAVQSPGVYTVPKGDSIGNVIKKAGGLLPYGDTESINLAEAVEDGEHIHIKFNFSGNPEALLRTQKININTASLKELDSLPGIGPAMAKRIDEYRQSKGHFGSIEDIKDVKGIGDGVFNKIKDKITI